MEGVERTRGDREDTHKFAILHWQMRALQSPILKQSKGEMVGAYGLRFRTMQQHFEAAVELARKCRNPSTVMIFMLWHHGLTSSILIPATENLPRRCKRRSAVLVRTKPLSLVAPF